MGSGDHERPGQAGRAKDPDRRCETCRYDLGGGYNNCRINLEAECASGDYEAWEEKENGEGEEV